MSILLSALQSLMRLLGHSVTNVLASIFALLALVLAGILYWLFGWTQSLVIVLFVPMLFILVIALNYARKTTAARILFCLTPIFLTMAATIVGKIEANQSYITYFDSRYILLVTSILPAVVFDLVEWRKIAICLLSTLVTLLLFDPIHHAFGVGYFQQGFEVKSYYYINYITFISFVALVSGIFVLKWRNWRASKKALRVLLENKRINAELRSQNESIQNMAHEVEAQNEEILQQHEEMVTHQEMLSEANHVITEQKAKLERYNSELEKLIEEKSGDLAKTNEELIKSNNELRQFSFTVSHNLRGPVARLLGLTNLITLSQQPNELTQFVSFIQQSASELDSILRDLSTIIDIRNELYRVKEKISLSDEWRRAATLIGDSQFVDVTVEADFATAPHLFGIRPMVQNILFNLISNAIKYQSNQRPLEIRARSWVHLDHVMLEITDNGLGFDLSTQQDNVFKLYKRFHTHVPGKGMGLYLVRSQLDIMNGRIEVESEVNVGTTFRLIFPVPEDLSKQVFFENDAAQLYYDAYLNNTVIIWKQNVTSEQYRQAFESVLLTLKKYNTPGWIADLREQGTIMPEDQLWFVNEVLKAAAQNGLSRIGAVGFNDPIRKDYYDRMTAVTGEYGIELRVFDDMESAVLWMKRFTV